MITFSLDNEVYNMHEMFSYKRVKERLLRESYYWDRVFTTIENFINTTQVAISYPKNLYLKKGGNISLYLFTKSCIYCINFLESENEFDIRIIKVDNIIEMNLKVKKDGNVVLTIYLKDENIQLSSKDDTNEYQSYKYAEALLEIAKIYSV